MAPPLPKHDDPGSLAALVDYARSRPCTVEDVVELAQHLGTSGLRLVWPSSMSTADVASTGGPASLSTLVPPLALVALGARVVKLAVRGRPAGAIDTLATIPGYKCRLAEADVQRVVAECGFAHFLADERFAPLDATLFEYRRARGAVAIPLLVQASLLAKKSAVGLKRVGLDVRVGTHGNLGATRDEARVNARMFCGAARKLGIEAVAFLSSEVGPVQPWIGRGESLLALGHAVGILSLDDSKQWLDQHMNDCARMASATAGVGGRCSVGAGAIRDALRTHLVAQGSSWQAFESRLEALSTVRREPITAMASGFNSIRLDVIRDALVNLQSTDDDPDPAGLELVARAGARVERGQVIARVRCNSRAREQELLRRLSLAFRSTAEPSLLSGGMEEVRA